MPIGIAGKVSLTCVIDDSIQANLIGSCDQFYIVEDSSQLIPTAFLKFTDSNGLIMDCIDKLIAGEIRFDVGWPENNETDNLESHYHRLFDVKESEQLSTMSPSSISLELATWSRLGPALTIPDYVRSFGDVPASTIIEQIVSEVGGTLKTIESSSDSERYLQAQWTNSQMIRHLADEAVSADGKNPGFLFFFDREEKFTFASPKYLFGLNKPDSADDTKTLVFTNNQNANNDDATFILAYSFSTDAKYWLTKNGYGTIFKWYDTADYSYKEETKKLSDSIANFSMVDYTMMESAYSDLTKSIYTGRERNTSEHLLRTRYQASMINMDVLIRYKSDLHLGDVLRIVLPVPDDSGRPDEPRVILDTLSSYWMVSRITHYVDSVNSDMMMKIKLTRSGVAIKDSDKLL